MITPIVPPVLRLELPEEEPEDCLRVQVEVVVLSVCDVKHRSQVVVDLQT